ncbi:phosphatidyl synthase [Phakopsora pachyrhizi]|uniref:Phosphatidyl synthase n=1 Tax=Phakopsora pachyrhizi TaxID=170000 RepID=A0AAV0AIN8_PHAPC|nr:phosphatidyl synthase [Phakopsora pachyrhizi]CAH7667109.1 phosphatidyl synthase [Phakopsora pachyrhizi]
MAFRLRTINSIMINLNSRISLRSRLKRSNYNQIQTVTIDEIKGYFDRGSRIGTIDLKRLVGTLGSDQPQSRILIRRRSSMRSVCVGIRKSLAGVIIGGPKHEGDGKFYCSKPFRGNENEIKQRDDSARTKKAGGGEEEEEEEEDRFKILSERPKPKLITKENILTIPNMLTSTRILLCPILSYTISEENYMVSCLIVGYCGFSDWLDGRLARKYPEKMSSVFGTILDPAADKILMTTLVFSLSFKGLLPLPLAVLIVGRDLLLSISAIYFRYESLPIPKTFNRFWDFSLPSAEVKPTLISKYNTMFQLILVGMTILNPILDFDLSILLVSLQWIVGFTTLVSGMSYMFSRSAIRYIK